MWIVLVVTIGLGENPARLLDEVGQLMAQGHADVAARRLKSWLEGPGSREGTSGRGRVLAALGMAARELGDFETAAPAFGKAFALEGDPGSAIDSAECYLEMNNPLAAETVLLKCESHPDPRVRAYADQLRGMALFLKSREEEARPYLERARKGGCTGASHFLGILHFQRGEHEKALGFLEEATRADPGDYYSHLYRGWALLELNRLDHARRALMEVRNIAATPEVEDMLGRTELRAERFEKALIYFRAALRKNPGYVEAQNGVATALRRLGRKEEARVATKAFRKLFQAHQKNLQIAFALDQKQLANPKDPGIAEKLGLHYLSTFELQNAERYAWKALSLDPDRIPSRLLLARALARSGRYQFAALHYKKILQAQPGHGAARSELEDLIRKHARRKTPPGRKSDD